MHRQAGALVTRFHAAGEVTGLDRTEAEAALLSAADGAKKHLARAGGRLTEDHRQIIRNHAERLRRVDRVRLSTRYLSPPGAHPRSRLRPAGRRLSPKGHEGALVPGQYGRWPDSVARIN
ncbi:hypothetical protein GCM10027074_75770 [Streptomyces deserti]